MMLTAHISSELLFCISLQLPNGSLAPQGRTATHRQTVSQQRLLVFLLHLITNISTCLTFSLLFHQTS